MIRRPVVNGTFYPDDKNSIREFLSAAVPGKQPKKTARGLILPHAGYVYSGKVAAVTASRVIATPTIVILGPNHTGTGKTFSAYSRGTWITPLGEVAVNQELAAAVLSQEGPISEDATAHAFEHSIEVELPVLQYFFEEFTFLPICCQTASWKEYSRAAHQIYTALKSRKENALIVASSDMTHYEPDAMARKKDRTAIEPILRLDEKGLLETVRKEHLTMCGIAPVSIMLILTKLLGATKAEVALYQTSGDSSGDYSSVVGYLGAIIT